MRSLAPAIGILVIVGLIIKYIWWIIGAAALILLYFAVRSMVRAERAHRNAIARRNARITARADQQHRWVLDGDDRGVYGPYPIPDVIKELNEWE